VALNNANRGPERHDSWFGLVAFTRTTPGSLRSQYSLSDKRSIDPSAKLRNETDWHTSVSLYVDEPWVFRNFVIRLNLLDGEIIRCAMTSGYINIGQVITAQCDTMILYKDMGTVPSAVVFVNPAGT